jgi:hypothetical protein
MFLLEQIAGRQSRDLAQQRASAAAAADRSPARTESVQPASARSQRLGAARRGAARRAARRAAAGVGGRVDVTPATPAARRAFPKPGEGLGG